MWVFKMIYSTVIDALFPLSTVERELLSYTPEQAYAALPPAPVTPITDTHSVFAYKDERAGKLVWNIKYKKSQAAVALGGYALHQKMMELNIPLGSIIVPIPITARRRRERGFNQCELLLKEVERLDTDRRWIFRDDLLVRTQHISRQTLKGRTERLESARGIFAITEHARDQLKGRTVVIIDDVITTGSTILEAMETVRKAGAEKVIGISVAH
jgi:ComF family protein